MAKLFVDGNTMRSPRSEQFQLEGWVATAPFEDHVGLTIASALPHGVEEDRVAAMSAAMLSLGERIASELGRGSLEQVLIKGDKGYVLMTYAGEDAVLTVLAKSQAKLGLIFLDVKRAAESISKVI